VQLDLAHLGSPTAARPRLVQPQCHAPAALAAPRSPEVQQLASPLKRD